MNRLQQYIIGKIGKFKHEIDMEAHAYDRLYWMDLRQRGMKRDLEDLQQRVNELEKTRHDESWYFLIKWQLFIPSSVPSHLI